MAKILDKIINLQKCPFGESEDILVGNYKNSLHVLKYSKIFFSKEENLLWDFLLSSNSEGIFHPIEFGEHKKKSYIIFPWIKGVSFKEIGKQSPYFALRFLRSVVKTLWELEQNGFVHGDVSSKNILLKSNLEAVLIDPALTGLGTLVYCAPERFSNAKASVSSDIYSCGIFLYEMISGKFPEENLNFENLSAFACGVESFSATDKLFSLGISAEVLSALEPIWKSTLRYSPEDRASSFEELDEILEIAENALKPSPLILEKEILELQKNVECKIQTPVITHQEKSKRNVLLVSIISFAILMIIMFSNLSGEKKNIDETAKKILEKSKGSLNQEENLLQKKEYNLNLEKLETMPLPIGLEKEHRYE